MNFTIKWTNRSRAIQDWMIYQTDTFTLDPDWERSADITINNSYTYQVAVSTNGGFAACNLSYDAPHNQWTVSSSTPLEWQLIPPNGSEPNGTVILNCLLEDVDQYSANPAYLSFGTAREIKY